MGMIILDNVRNATAYFWGERTSTIDWCEENYLISKYIAEFWNTLTNSVFVILALMGIYTSIKYKQGKRIMMCYVCQLGVGIGSGIFHATLKYTTQLLDELPMLYTSAVGFYALVEMDREIRYGRKLPLAIAVFQIGVSATYLFWIQNPIFHQIAFAFTTIGAVWFGYMRITETKPSNRTRRKLNRLLLFGHIGMVGGFCIWNMDNIFCHNLRSYRSYIGTPIDVLLQFHGWWHVLTAYGCTYLLLWINFAKLARLGHDSLFTIRHSFGLFPHIALKDEKKIV